MKPKDLKRTGEWNFQDILFCVVHETGGTRVWLGSSDFSVYEIDPSQEKPERIALQGEGHSSYVTGIVRTGESLISCSYDRKLIWWDINQRKIIRSVDAHQGWIRSIIASPDGARIFSVGDDMQCKVWNATTGEAVATFSDHALKTPHHYPSMLYAVAASPDGQWIATGDRVGHVAIWDAESFVKVSEVEAAELYTWDPRARRHSIGGIRSLAFSPDSRRLSVGGIGKIGNVDHLDGAARLEVFDWVTGNREVIMEDKKMKGLIEQVAWSPEGDWILTAGGDHNGFITIYDSESGELIHQESQHGHIHGVAHDDQFANIFVAGHERLSRWSMAAKT